MLVKPIDSPPFAQKVVDLINKGNMIASSNKPETVDDVYGLDQGALSNSSQQNFSLVHNKQHVHLQDKVCLFSNNSPTA